MQGSDDREAANELGDQAVLEEVFRHHLGEEVADAALALAFDAGAEAKRLVAHPALDQLVQPLKGTTADEEDVGGVDLHVLLLRVLASALGGHAGNGALQDLQQRLLDALAGDIAGDGGVLRLAGDLVDLVNVDDPLFRFLQVIIGRLDQFQQDILHIFTYIPRFGQRGGVGDGKGHVQHLCQVLRKVRLPHPGWPEHHDVGLLDLHIVLLVTASNSLVVVIHGYGQDLLGLLLPDNVLIEELLDLFRFRDILEALFGVLVQFLGDYLVTQLDTFVANIHTRTSDEPLNLVLVLAAKRTLQSLLFLESEHPFTSVIWRLSHPE